MSSIKHAREREAVILLDQPTMVGALLRHTLNLFIPSIREVILMVPLGSEGGSLTTGPWTAVVSITEHEGDFDVAVEEVLDVGQAGLAHSVARFFGDRPVRIEPEHPKIGRRNVGVVSEVQRNSKIFLDRSSIEVGVNREPVWARFVSRCGDGGGNVERVSLHAESAFLRLDNITLQRLTKLILGNPPTTSCAQ